MTSLAKGRSCQGFTLTELAIVMAVITLLIGGLLMPLTTQMENHRRQETERALAEIREALLGFAYINGRLPCPADRAIASGTANAGLEATTLASGTCACTDTSNGIAAIGATACDNDDNGAPSGVSGVLPWATLGLPEIDAWGQRYTYRVTTRFARVASGQTQFGCTPSSNPTTAAFALCSAGDMTVRTVTGGATLASGIPVIIVSHGKSGGGAWLSTAAQVAGAAGDEAANANGGIDFVSNTSIDDILTWIPPSVLMSRMIAAGKLP